MVLLPCMDWEGAARFLKTRPGEPRVLTHRLVVRRPAETVRAPDLVEDSRGRPVRLDSAGQAPLPKLSPQGSPPELSPKVGTGTVVRTARKEPSRRITPSVVEAHLNPLAREVRKRLGDDLPDLLLSAPRISGGRRGRGGGCGDGEDGDSVLGQADELIFSCCRGRDNQGS